MIGRRRADSEWRECRVIPRERIKLITVTGRIPPGLTDREAVIRQAAGDIGAGIAAALLAHGKVWFSEDEGLYLAAVQVIVPDPTFRRPS
jgi:hypothetical protein